MFVGLKCTQELLQQLIAIQNVLKSPSKSDVLRRLVQDAYQKFFAFKLSIDSKNILPTPDEVAAELSMRNGVPFLPAASGMAMRLKECWPRMTEEQREYYRTMCGWSKENVETFFGL